MDAFSYLSVLVAIILGLGITKLLTGLGALIQARARVRVYGPALGWAGILLVAIVQHWWSLFGERDRRDWTFLEFFAVLLLPILFYLASALALPDVPPEGEVDLRANYFGHYRWFHGLFLAIFFASLAKRRLLDGHLPFDLDTRAHLAFIAIATGAVATRREWYHRLITAVVGCLVLAYIAALFARLK